MLERIQIHKQHTQLYWYVIMYNPNLCGICELVLYWCWRLCYSSLYYIVVKSNLYNSFFILTFVYKSNLSDDFKPLCKKTRNFCKKLSKDDPISCLTGTVRKFNLNSFKIEQVAESQWSNKLQKLNMFCSLLSYKENLMYKSLCPVL